MTPEEELRKKWEARKPETPDDIVECLSVFESLREVSRRTPQTYGKCFRLAREAVRLGLMSKLKTGGHAREDAKKPGLMKLSYGRLHERKQFARDLPPDGKINRYIFTCAQNDTALHRPVFENMLALIEHYKKDKRCANVELHISRITYVHAGLGDSGNKDYVTRNKKRGRALYEECLLYPPELIPFFSDERILIAPGLFWCGEMNILPTAERPLSGLESYTGRKSGIFPHTKVAMDSIASMPNEGTKFNYTTGALTVRNYIARKAGQKAEFHHTYGGLLVEVDSVGNFWCRQLVADSDGVMYDIDVKVSGGVVVKGNYIDSVVWGDIHEAIIDTDVAEVCWFKKGNLLDRLRPKRQFLHDLLDFHSRSHHEIRHPMKMFSRFVEGSDDVAEELQGSANFLVQAERDWCETIIVNSNHDRHLGRWLNEADARFDYVNVEFWSKMWVACTDLIRRGLEPNYLRVGLELVGYDGKAHILEQDESYVVCGDDNGGIECGIHGDDGPNGARGSPLAFAKMGRRMVTAHRHWAGIESGVYTVGTSSTLKPKYVVGPSAWSHSFCLIYENGKRALITLWHGKERA